MSDENKQEKLSIVRFFFVALLIVIAVFLIGMVLGITYDSVMIICAITFEIFLVNAIYSNHIIKQTNKVHEKLIAMESTLEAIKSKK